MRLPSLGDVGLHILALILAITVYHLVKSGTSHPETTHDRTFFNER